MSKPKNVNELDTDPVGGWVFWILVLGSLLGMVIAGG